MGLVLVEELVVVVALAVAVGLAALLGTKSGDVGALLDTVRIGLGAPLLVVVLEALVSGSEAEEVLVGLRAGTGDGGFVLEGFSSS